MLATLLVAAVLAASQSGPERAADLVLRGGRVWTVDPGRPEAQAVATRGDRIVAVGTNAEVAAWIGPMTEVIDLDGRLLLPGFNDGHTHLENASDWQFQAGLFDTDDPKEVIARVARIAGRVPKGLWITGGDYGAPSAWATPKGEAPRDPPVLRREDLDAVSPNHPVLLKRADGARFANSMALRLARFTDAMPDPRGGRMERDPKTGVLTGLLFGRAADRVAELMPPPSLARKLAGARLVLRDFARYGVTSIGDIARLPAASDRALFETHYERSATNLEIFRELQRRAELSVRVTAHLTLRLHEEYRVLGVKPWSDDGLIRIGGLKAYVDGYLMEDIEPPARRGDFTFRFPGEEAMAKDVREADLAGFDPVIHTIGDRAHRLLLNWYEAAIRQNPVRDRRFRVIHAEYPSSSDIARMGRMKMIVDFTPAHLLRDLKAVERRAGDRLLSSAYAWKSMVAAGVRLNLVSDMPGSFNEQESKPFDPIELIADAVNREPLTETGALGPAYRGEEGLTVQEAIAAMTANPAFSSFEESRKGSIKPGLLADFVVLSEDILALPGAEIRRARVDLTILGGKTIYRRSSRSFSSP